MPIYEYICRTCGKTTDVLQKINDAPLTHCDACNNDTLEKLISAPSFQLKGSGWYATDFKGGTKAPAEKTETKTEAKSDDSTGGACGSGGCSAC